MVYSLIAAAGRGGEAQEGTSRRQQIAQLIAPLGRDRSATIVALQLIQQELGYLPPETFEEVGRHLGVSPSEVYGVATFYAQFYLTQSGRNRIMACRGTACHVKGASRVLRGIKKHLGIGEGQTTPDGEFTLETIACIGACALAPTMMVNKEVYGKLTPGRAADILSARRTRAEK